MSEERTAFDALVVGAGYIGCSVACHLALAGLRTALLEQGDIGCGASRANYGNIQVQDAELDHSLPLTVAGWQSWQRIGEELSGHLGFRRIGSLLVVETPEQWALLAARVPRLRAAGIKAEMVPADRLPEIEPLLDHRAVLGACYHPDEARVWPFRIMHAYVERGCERGLEARRETTVTGFRVRSGRLEGVTTDRGDLSAPVVVLTTGAWTPALGRLLGHDWQTPHVHGQALVTESSPLRLRNHLSSAAFFEAMHENEGHQPPPAVMAIAQSGNGNFLLGEAGLITDDLGKQSTARGLAAVAAEALRYIPALRGLRAIRGWASPVAFTADGLPFFGPLADLPGLILATAFKSTVIVTPLAGRLVTQLVLGQPTDIDLRPFSPDRSIASSPARNVIAE
jgi:sarcosine oxidase, subunit beta